MPRKIKRRETGIKRKRKFNLQTRNHIYAALKSEIPVKRAARLAGIDYSTYREWLKKGLDANYPVHAAFRLRVNKILARIEMKKLRVIQKASEGYSLHEKTFKISKRGKTLILTVREVPIDWRACVWFLERRFPERYGKSALHQIPDVDTGTLAAQVKSNFDELLKSIPVSP